MIKFVSKVYVLYSNFVSDFSHTGSHIYLPSSFLASYPGQTNSVCKNQENLNGNYSLTIVQRSHYVKMPRGAKRYNKEKLLEILQEQCPTALRAFPSPDSFRFHIDNDKDKTAYLKVGFAINDKGRTKGAAWVEVNGTCKPWLYVRTITNGHVNMNSHRWVKCEGAFRMFTKLTSVYAWNDQMKALVSFVFVYTGHKETFADFDRGNGLHVLIGVLNSIEARAKSKGSSSGGKEKVAADKHDEGDNSQEQDSSLTDIMDEPSTNERENKEEIIIKKAYCTTAKRGLDVCVEDDVIPKKKLRVE